MELPPLTRSKRSHSHVIHPTHVVDINTFPKNLKYNDSTGVCLCEVQVGYCCKRSTVNAITSITELLREKRSNSGTKCVYLDLRKAFDTIDHAILKAIMDLLGMRCNVLNWFGSYLSDRR